MSGRKLRLLLWGLVAINGAALAWMLVVVPKMNATAESRIGKGDYTLVTTEGAPFTSASLGTAPSAVFFGFTHCPDVCPMTLGILKQVAALNAHLPAPDQARMVFVSVDPARDTPAQIKTYVEYFGPQFSGLTGTAEQIDIFARASSVAYFVGEPDENGQYPVDHSNALFVVNPHGQIAAVFTAPHSSEQIAADLRAIVRLARRDRA